VPLAEIAELLADDREGYIPPAALVPAINAAAAPTGGSLLTKSTIDIYVYGCDRALAGASRAWQR
jgi:hypothetical protein